MLAAMSAGARAHRPRAWAAGRTGVAAIPMRRFLAVRLAQRVALGAILACQAFAALQLRNAAFEDEATFLGAGHQIIGQMLGGPAPAEPYVRYFAGLPYIHAPLAAALDSIGGLEAARLLSLACLLWVTSGVYLVGRELGGAAAGLVAAGLFAGQGPVLFLSRIATYDCIALALLALAAVLAVRPTGRRQALLIGAVLLGAVFTKYMVFFFVPTVLAILVDRGRRIAGWQEALRWAGLALGVVLGGAVLALAIPQAEILRGVATSTAAHETVIAASLEQVAERTMAWGGPLSGVALLGALLVGRRLGMLSIVLVGAALVMPAAHAATGELVSLHKHVAYGLFFAAPLAGLGLAHLPALRDRLRAVTTAAVGTALGAAMLAGGLERATTLYAYWPNVDPLVEDLRSLGPLRGRVLAEEHEVLRYYLRDITTTDQWVGLYEFAYPGNACLPVSGAEAYRAAIRDGYFQTVVLRYGPAEAMARSIEPDLRSDGNYTLTATIPYRTVFGPGTFWIWSRRSQAFES